MSDNGPAIGPEVLARIFEPSFTTKGKTVGTGLGLSICRDAARIHGGDSSVELTEGLGAVLALSGASL